MERPLLTTREAIQTVAAQLADEAVICTTGYTCRDMQAAADRPSNFYMIGSMGLAASFGLGVALSSPKRRVVVFDGDGSALMGLGAFPSVAALAPANFIHVVFDNEVFASTGNQPTYSGAVGLDRLASAAGYRTVRRVTRAEELISTWRQIRLQEGPIFLLVKCRPDSGPPAPRVRLDPEQIRARFMEELNASS